MENYKILFKRSVKKDIQGIPKKDIQKILKRITALAENPRPSTSEKLTAKEEYRVRQGVYRILYTVDDKERQITIVKIAHRNTAYKN
jgi:mRNA interferase RelE/StbE